ILFSNPSLTRWGHVLNLIPLYSTYQQTAGSDALKAVINKCHVWRVENSPLVNRCHIPNSVERPT
ncbi:hypothetical protein B0H12DRAFT_1165127, partial [Mycena haematopus]